MRLIIEARLADGDNDTVNDGDGVLVVVERRDCKIHGAPQHGSPRAAFAR
jgi:hypothetical protein